MRLRLPRRRLVRALIYIVCVVLMVLAADMVWAQMRRHITPGFDTTRIVSPVMGDGRVDYLKAIEDYWRDGVTPENNAAIPMLQAFGRSALPSRQPTDGITDRLGMPHLPEQGNYFISYERFCDQHHEPYEPDPTVASEGKIAFPSKAGGQTKQWLNAIEKPLALLSEASKRPRFFFPINGGYRYEMLLEAELPYLAPFRACTRGFLTRAMLRIQAGDFVGFHNDVMTAHRLARLLSHSPFVVNRIVAFAVEKDVCEVERAVAAGGKLSALQANETATELAELGDVDGLVDPINRGERYFWLDAIQFLAKSSPQEAGRIIDSMGRGAFVIPPHALWLIPVPYEQAMRAANHYDDGIVAVLQLPTYIQRKAVLESWLQRSDARPNPTVWQLLSAEGFTSSFLLNVTSAEERYQAARMQTRLTQIALGLAAYQAEHHAYPNTLAALSPDDLKVIPNDVFTDGPVMYAPTATGYRLYSVGPNMKDDGGKASKPADDIVADNP